MMLGSSRFEVSERAPDEHYRLSNPTDTKAGPSTRDPHRVDAKARGHARNARVLAASAFLVCVLALALLQIRGWNGAVNADGVSYLDLAAQYAHGDLGAVANGYWSPLYPMLLGAGLALSRVPIVYLGTATLTPELRVVYAVNVVVLLVVTGLLIRLLRALDARDASELPRHVRATRAIASAALWVWCAIRLIMVTTITPDVLLAGWLFLVSLELVEASTQAPCRRRAVRLAIALSLGYCTKAVFFPLLFVGALAYVVSIPRASWRAHLPWLVGPMLAVAGPLIAVQSISQGHLSFGETGRLNYGWYVGGVPHATARAELVDATHVSNASRPGVIPLSSDPRSALYVGRVGGSFSYWYDPSRFEGSTHVSVSLGAQIRAIRANLLWYRVTAGWLAWLCVVAMLAAVARQRFEARRLLAMAPSCMLLLLYLLTHPEGRLAGPAIAVTFVLALYVSGSRRRFVVNTDNMWARIESATLMLLVVFALGRTSNRVPLRPQPAIASPIREIARMEIPPGSRVGVIGSPYGQYWAHQSGLRISAVRETTARDSTADRVEPAEIAAESCTRGMLLAAILWRREDMYVDPGDVSSSDWVVWKVRSTCFRRS